MKRIILFTAGAFGFMLWLFIGDNRRKYQRVRRTHIAEIQISNTTIQGDIDAMELQEGQSAQLNVNLKTRRGHAAAIEPGSGRWTSTDESVVTVTADPNDETRATIEGVDGSENESVVIEFRADGKRGDGVREIVATLAVTCTQGDAVVAEINAGEPVDSPADGESEPIPGNETAANPQ
jgi:hypothetical protein